MKIKGIRRFFSFVIVFTMMFTMIMPVGVAYAAAVISTVSTVANGAVNPSIVVTLAGDTFTGALGQPDLTAKWTITPGTGLTLNTIIIDTTTQATITFTGTAGAGTIAVQGNNGALTLGVASNLINVVVPGFTFTTDPLNNAKGIPVNQIITLTTSVPCTIENSIGITLNDGSIDVELLPPTVDDKKITIVPKVMLSCEKTYTLTIPAGSFAESATPANTNAIFISQFTTAYNMSTLINDSTTFNSLISLNSPRKLNVMVPKRYMTKFNISYAAASNLVTPLTNVDITADAMVGFIKVKFGTAAPIDAWKTGTLWNTGFSGSLVTADPTIGQDIIFAAYDKYERLLETKNIKLNPKGNKVDLSSTKSLSVLRTFADLVLNNGKLFADILKQYDINELTLSVAN